MNLAGIQLASTDISNADFTNVDFTNASFIDIDFRTANVSHANFKSARFDLMSLRSIISVYEKSRFYLDNVNIEDAFNMLPSEDKRDLLKQILPLAKSKKILLQKIDLSYADLSELDLTGLYLAEANFMGTKLDKSDLSYANLTRANLKNASFCQAKLNRVNWSNCNIEGCNFARSDGVTGHQIKNAKYYSQCTGLPPKVLEYLKQQDRKLKNYSRINNFFNQVPKRKNREENNVDSLSNMPPLKRLNCSEDLED